MTHFTHTNFSDLRLRVNQSVGQEKKQLSCITDMNSCANGDGKCLPSVPDSPDAATCYHQVRLAGFKYVVYGPSS